MGCLSNLRKLAKPNSQWSIPPRELAHHCHISDRKTQPKAFNVSVGEQLPPPPSLPRWSIRPKKPTDSQPRLRDREHQDQDEGKLHRLHRPETGDKFLGALISATRAVPIRSRRVNCSGSLSCGPTSTIRFPDTGSKRGMPVGSFCQHWPLRMAIAVQASKAEVLVAPITAQAYSPYAPSTGRNHMEH